MESLKDQIFKAKNGDSETTNRIIEHFNPLIKKYSRQLGYEDAYDDLIIWMIGAIKSYKGK